MVETVGSEMRQQDFERPCFQLHEGRIEVWCVELEAPISTLRQLDAILSGEEKGRASNFKFERHRTAFILARGLLRSLAARYLGISGSDIRFEYGANGKPHLTDSNLDFNISHTDGMAVFAFALDCALGVDVERVRDIEDMLQIAQRFFAPSEAEELMSLPNEHRQKAFFDCWTRKEAFLKATGTGLSSPLSEFQVTTTPTGEPTLLIPAWSGESSWILRDLRMSSDFSGAIVYKAGDRKLVQSGVLSPLALLESRIEC